MVAIFFFSSFLLFGSSFWSKFGQFCFRKTNFLGICNYLKLSIFIYYYSYWTIYFLCDVSVFARTKSAIEFYQKNSTGSAQTTLILQKPRSITQIPITISSLENNLWSGGLILKNRNPNHEYHVSTLCNLNLWRQSWLGAGRVGAPRTLYFW